MDAAESRATEAGLTARQGKSFDLRVHALASSLFKGSQQFYGARFGLGVPEMRILSNLGREGALTPGELVSATAMDKALVSRLLAAMARRGFIAATAGPSPKRRRWALSRAGERLVRRLRPLWRRREAAVLAGLSAGQRRLLTRLLERLFAASEKLRLDDARQLKAARGRTMRQRKRRPAAAKPTRRRRSGTARARTSAR